MKEKLCLILFVALACSSRGEVDPRFNFPDNLEPKEYLIKLKTDFKNEKRFWGDIVIQAICKKATTDIVLNAKDLKIDKKSVKVKLVSENPEDNIDISDPRWDTKAEQYIIPVKKELVAKSQYEIHISFGREFSHDFNVYQFYTLIEDTFSDEKLKSKEDYGFTRIGPGQARRLFPLFDQMRFKTKIELIHDHPRGVTGFSNMPLKKTEDSTQGEDWESDIFEKSIPMSTHTFGFALAKLEQRKDKDPRSGATISVWSNSRTFPQTDFFLEMIIRIFNYYSEYFKVDYSLPKLDILILSQYKGSYDKDTFGLIFFGISGTLDSESLMDQNKKKEMAMEMCEAVCHQWIGTYTTMTTWNQHWLHRALVHLFSTPCVEKAFPQDEWHDYSDSVALTAFIDVLEDDLYELGDPVYIPDDNVDNSYGDSDSIESVKAYLLVRMLRLSLGEVVFQNSMEEYLKRYGEGNSTLKQVWQIFTDKANVEKKLPYDTTVEQIMDSWSTKNRYPLFKVDRNYETNMVKITQEPFVLDEEERKAERAAPSKDCWISLITYTTEDGSVDGEDRHWFLCKKGELTISLKKLEANKWIIFNLRIAVPSRNVYDYDNWNLLSKALLDGEKFKKIDELTRAGLIFDMFEFARAGILENLGYPFLLDTLKYLINEDSYFVWSVVEIELEKLLKNLYRTKLFDPYQEYIRAILTKVFEKFDLGNVDELIFHDLDLKRQNLIFNVSCHFGVKLCETQSLGLFKTWYDNLQLGENISIPKDIRKTVLCSAIKQDNKNWAILLEKYDRSDRLKMNSKIFSALGCSTNIDTLKEYFNIILSYSSSIAHSDREDIFSSLAWNKDGYPLVKDLLTSRHEDIETRFPGRPEFIDAYLEKLLNATTMKEDLKEITDFMEKVRPENNPEYESLWEANVMKVRNNIKWYEQNEHSLSDFLKNQDLSKLFE